MRYFYETIENLQALWANLSDSLASSYLGANRPPVFELLRLCQKRIPGKHALLGIFFADALVFKTTYQYKGMKLMT